MNVEAMKAYHSKNLPTEAVSYDDYMHMVTLANGTILELRKENTALKAALADRDEEIYHLKRLLKLHCR